MKNVVTTFLIIICYIAFMQNTFAAKHELKVDVYSNEKSFPRKVFSFYIDFQKEINLSSLKMKLAGKKNKQVAVYAVPLGKYKAFIYFMPHKKMEEDSELSYVLSFENGKWDEKAVGSDSLKKIVNKNPNLIPNYSFEKVTKTIDRYMTWNGRTSITAWSLQDYSMRFSSLDDIKSTCRSSSKEAFMGKRSLCFSNGKPRVIKIRGRERNTLISGSAHSKKIIKLKPDTTYKLSFFVKITKRIDNEMNFQGVSVSLSLQDYYKRPIYGGLFSALYSINAIMEEEYLNKWVYVEAYERTGKNTYYGKLNISEKISGTTYIDAIELREVKSVEFPEIVIGKE